ncbi:hypothetical protein [Pseudogracilibacillus sp. SO30301A]|uniref:hypothetical protein n=1 Tax=Pseudogracilibacillus sp. SO30301A TaxID=3098291 RepID=UPI00300E5B5A
MSRFITISLLLLVFFFGGMSYGSFEKDRITVHPNKEEPIIEQQEIMESTPVSSETYSAQNGENLIHKTASFFEKIVTTAYEIVINILYAIANLFFD